MKWNAFDCYLWDTTNLQLDQLRYVQNGDQITSLEKKSKDIFKYYNYDPIDCLWNGPLGTREYFDIYCPQAFKQTLFVQYPCCGCWDMAYTIAVRSSYTIDAVTHNWTGTLIHQDQYSSTACVHTKMYIYIYTYIWICVYRSMYVYNMYIYVSNTYILIMHICILYLQYMNCIQTIMKLCKVAFNSLRLIQQGIQIKFLTPIILLYQIGSNYVYNMISVAYRYRKSISIIELFVSIISIYIEFLATNF